MTTIARFKSQIPYAIPLSAGIFLLVSSMYIYQDRAPLFLLAICPLISIILYIIAYFLIYCASSYNG